MAIVDPESDRSITFVKLHMYSIVAVLVDDVVMLLFRATHTSGLLSNDMILPVVDKSLSTYFPSPLLFVGDCGKASSRDALLTVARADSERDVNLA